MSSSIFRIPRQTDRQVIAAMVRIRDRMRPRAEATLHVQLPAGETYNATTEHPESDPKLQHIIEADSEVIQSISLKPKKQQGQPFLTFQRKFDRSHDEVQFNLEPWNLLPEADRSQAWVTAWSASRTELKAFDIEVGFRGSDDATWARYRDAQSAVLNSLQNTAETLLLKVAEKNAELDRARSARFEKLESDLRAQLTEERSVLKAEFEAKHAALSAQENELSERIGKFNTKEARYVARQKQDEQIKQVQDWLKDWRLTEGTHSHRRPIFWAYIAGLTVTGGVAVYAMYHNYTILKSAEDLANLHWWHWVLLSSKAVFPLAAFTTFIVYFVRWSSAWARQHADEEFRNRARLIDIGRSSWILEAVRDAQERNKELPTELAKIFRAIYSQLRGRRTPTLRLKQRLTSYCKAFRRCESSLRMVPRSKPNEGKGNDIPCALVRDRVGVGRPTILRRGDCAAAVFDFLEEVLYGEGYEAFVC